MSIMYPLVPWEQDVALCDGSSDRSFMVHPLSYFLFQPVICNWYNKGCGMCYPVCWVVHVKDPLLLIRKNSPCSGGSRFLLSLYEWSFTICLTPYNHIKHVEYIIKKNVLPSLVTCTDCFCPSPSTLLIEGTSP